MLILRSKVCIEDEIKAAALRRLCTSGSFTETEREGFAEAAAASAVQVTVGEVCVCEGIDFAFFSLDTATGVSSADRFLSTNMLMVGSDVLVNELDVDVGDEVCEIFCALTLVFGAAAASAVRGSPYFGPNEHKVQRALHCKEVKLAFVMMSAIWRVVLTYFMNIPGSSRRRSNNQSMSIR